MHRAFKIFVLWFLIAALPLQGFAAAMKVSCGAAHESAAASVSMHGMHDGDKAEAHDHKQKSAFCSACAACCVGAAAPPCWLDWSPVTGASELFFIAAMALDTSHIPGGLERPPRLHSA